MSDPVAVLAGRWRKSQADLVLAMTALLAVVEACRAYLPPDGIDASEGMSRVLAAVDNPTINPLLDHWEIHA